MHWSDIEQAQPALAKLAHDRLIDPGVVLVATVRRDGTPRLSPVEPLILDGDLWLSMMWRSAKALDLLRDPRILVHNIIASRSGTDGEFKIRGTASQEDDPALQRRYADTAASTLGWDPEPGKFHLFAVDIEHTAVISYDEPTGDQHVATWPPPAEFIRRATSATSVGGPEPVPDAERILSAS
jgi:pyridoxamine 5'-phosphate oxidase-like protein